jgi:hypothetical protein
MAQRLHQQDQQNLDLDSYESCPEWAKKIFLTPDELKSKSSKLFAFMRKFRLDEKIKGESYKTYAEMTELIFPIDSSTGKGQDKFSCKEYEEYQKLKRDKNKNTIKSLIRVRRGVLRTHLAKLDNENQRLAFLRNQGEWIVPIHKTESGSYRLVYVNPDLPLSFEESLSYRELTIEHSAMQDKNEKIADQYYRSGFEQLALTTLDPENFDTPDEEMDNRESL